MKKVSSLGFSVIGVFAPVLIISTIALAGWYVWQQKRGVDPAKNINDSSQTSDDLDKAQDKAAEQDAKQSESDKYLVIKEWGLRITLPEDLRGDISYFVNDRAEKNFGGPILIDFVSKRFSAGNLKCAVIEGDVPRALVGFYREGEGEDSETLEPKPFKHIGGSRYYFVGSACEDDIQREGSDQDRRLMTDLKKAIQDTLEVY